MEITQDNLKEMLVSPGHITQKDFELAISNAVSKKITVQQELIESGLISDENL
jgi:hypothetical protein